MGHGSGRAKDAPRDSGNAAIGRAGWRVVLPAAGEPARLERSGRFPDQDEYLRQVDRVLDLEALAPRTRTVARAFAIALYRRALARKVRLDVEATVRAAVTRAQRRLNAAGPQTLTRSLYAYQSESAGWERTRRERVDGGGPGAD